MLPTQCESQITDQSVLNLRFVGNWRALPASYNVIVRGPRHVLTARANATAAVLHFVAEPKPWSYHGRHAVSDATRRWRATCASFFTIGNGTRRTAFAWDAPRDLEDDGVDDDLQAHSVKRLAVVGGV